MKSFDKILILGIFGALAYVYIDEDEKQREEEGLAEGTNCGPLARLETDADGKRVCEPKLKCREGFVLSQDMTQCFDKANPCGPGFKMDEAGQCQIDDSICGDRCYKLNEAKDNCIKIQGCGTATGSEIGDAFLYLGESIVAGVIYDFLGRKIMSVAERKLQQEAAKKASIEAAKVAAQQAAGDVAKGGAKVTSLATKAAASRLAGRATQIAAKRGALQIAIIAAKKLAQKIAVQLAKIAALSSTGIGVLATPFMIMSTSLSIGLTAAGVFFEAPPGARGWDDVPESIQVLLTAIPIIGDVLDMTFPYIYFMDGCAPGLENQNELCYPPPDPDFTCEAFLCAAKVENMPGFNPNNFLGGTLFHKTKKLLTDTGRIPYLCRPGQVHGVESTDAAPGFCYDAQPEPGHVVLGTWWEFCKGDERDDLAFCGKEKIDPCGPGEWEVGRDCWGHRTDYLDDCTKGWDGCKHKSWNAAKCARGSDKCSWGCYQDNPFAGCGGCHKKIWTCDQYGDWDCIGGCPSTPVKMPELKKTFAARNFSFSSRAKASRVLAPHGNICPPGKSHEYIGLCYPNDAEIEQQNPGYFRRTYGFIEPRCPGTKDSWRGFQLFKDTLDIGTSCQLPTHTRPPYPKIHIGAKRRVVIEDPPDPPLPPLCSTLPTLPTTDKDYKQRLCRVSDPPAGFDLSADGLMFFKKCRDLFTFNFENGNCEKVLDDGNIDKYQNVEGLQQVEYDFY